MIIIPDLALHW